MWVPSSPVAVGIPDSHHFNGVGPLVTNSAIAATGGGVWGYIMITRERRAREAAERALAEERQRGEEDRRRAEERAEEDRRRAEQERSRLLAEIDRLTRQLDGQQNGSPEKDG